MPEIIYYTGIGANKSGRHTPQEFVKIMNKHFTVDCSTYKATNKISTCAQYKTRFNKELMKHVSSKSKVMKISKKTKKLKNNCDRQVKKSVIHSKPCNLEEYIEYSGAEKT